MKTFYEKIINVPEESFRTEWMVGSRVDSIYHCHPEYELTLIENGFGTRMTGDRIEPFAQWDLVLAGSMLPHHYLTRPEDSMGPEWARIRVLKFKRELLNPLLALPEFQPLNKLLNAAAAGLFFPVAVARTEAPLFRRMCEGSGWRRFLDFLTLLSHLAEAPHRHLSANAEPAAAQPDPRIDQALQFIHARLAQGRSVSLPEAAARASLTPQAFSGCFRRATRKRFIDYVTELKLSRAAQLLIHTDHGIAEVALAAGFENLSNFNRHFLRFRGLTPRAYRRMFHDA